jgi:hypothetical protein
MDSLGTARRYEVYSYLEGNLNYVEKIQNKHCDGINYQI